VDDVAMSDADDFSRQKSAYETPVNHILSNTARSAG
jgi:hypothetical protein